MNEFVDIEQAEAVTKPLSIYCVAVIRNEGDIIANFLGQAVALFDHTFVVDLQSTDGTREAIDTFSANNPGKITTFTCKTRRRGQSAMMNALARRAFGEGADWVFFLDAADFIAVENRGELLKFLEGCKDELIHLQGVNLVPSDYGRFEHFDATQSFFWRGKPEPSFKVALSSFYALLNPDFRVWDGNNVVSRSASEDSEPHRPGLELLHIPVRSSSRLKYQLTDTGGVLPETDAHVGKIMQRIQASQVTPGVLNSIAANFSIRDDATAELLPQSANWPTRLLPGHARASSGREVRSLAETVKRDSALVWDKPRFTEGTPVCAEFQGTDIRIRCLPMVAGRRLAYYGRYEKLPGETGQAGADLDLTVALKSVEAAFVRPDATTDEDWAVFAPILFALFAIARPRRFVNLGVNDGASLLTACRAAERFKIGTQCIAVDTWAHPGGGDDQSSQFEHFTRNLEEKYPRQHFIRAMFSEAVECFDDMSIDVLLIDAWADYDSAREQLELWLPKLSDVGIVLLRGTKAVREECGIWRLWTELKQKYPTVSFDHEDGLGVLYVGGSPSATAALMEMLGKDSQRTMLAQLFFERLGHLTARAARRPPEQHVGYREGDLLASTTVVKSMRRLLKLQLLRAKLIYLLMAPFARKQKHYAQKKQILRSGIRSLNSVLEDRAREHASRLRKPDPDAIHEKPPVGAYVAFNPEITPPGAPKGLHPKVRLIIPTRGCSKWLREFLKAYEDWGLKPTFAVDPGCEPKTLEILKATNTDMIFIDSTQIGNGEGIMPYLSKHVKEDYILRLDDDEFPTADFIAWVNSVPDSPYAFVTSWWIPRHEVALIDGEICSCHPKWLRVKVGNAVYENLHGGRFYRHRDVVYDQVGPHHGNFLSDYVSHCPPEARIVHLDYLVRTASERLAKLRVVEQRFPGNGWPFANHMIPEMAPRELLLPRKFHSPELDQLIAAILANIHEPSEEVVLKISEIAKIQQDRLTSDAIHFQY